MPATTAAMSIQVEPGGMAIATCSGVFRLPDAREGARQLWNTPGWPGHAALWDFREAQLELSASDVHALARFILENRPAPPTARLAFVTARNVDFGLARMFEVFREEEGTEFRVFRDYDEALEWVRSELPDDA